MVNDRKKLHTTLLRFLLSKSLGLTVEADRAEADHVDMFPDLAHSFEGGLVQFGEGHLGGALTGRAMCRHLEVWSENQG